MEAATTQKFAGGHALNVSDHPILPVAEKVHVIEHHFGEIMRALGLDLSDDSLKNTPLRVARMFVNEVFSGLDPLNEPVVTLFENKYRYGEIILEKDIPLYSYCEHGGYHRGGTFMHRLAWNKRYGKQDVYRQLSWLV